MMTSRTGGVEFSQLAVSAAFPKLWGPRVDGEDNTNPDFLPPFSQLAHHESGRGAPELEKDSFPKLGLTYLCCPGFQHGICRSLMACCLQSPAAKPSPEVRGRQGLGSAAG